MSALEAGFRELRTLQALSFVETDAQIDTRIVRESSKKVTFSSSRPLVPKSDDFEGRKRMGRPCHSISK